jgi:chemotaxis protein CheX
MAPGSALGIAGKMNGGDLFELDELSRDTISELASMITGRAVSILNDAGHRLKVSPPTLLTGENVTISNLELEALVVPLHTSHGDVVVNVAIATG